MRHTRSSSGVHQGTSGHANGSQRSSQRQGQTSHRTQLSLNSPPRLKHHRSGPSMSAERFLLILGQIQSRANELWEREQAELQRGAELMVIRCHQPPTSPQQAQAPPQADNTVSSPFYTLDPAPMLHAHSQLHSPSLIPAAHSFQSPSWSNDDFSAIAASLILPGPVADTSEEHAGGALAPCALHSSGHHIHHGAGQQQLQQPMAWQPLGTLYDIEAHVSLPHGLPCGGGGVSSATARSAKARLFDRFDSNNGAGTATARQAQQADPFCCSFTPVADDFLGSPSWARAYL